MMAIRKNLKAIVIVSSIILILASGMFIPIRSKTFISQIENKYEFLSKTVLTVDYNNENITYEKDVFLPQRMYNAYNIGDNYTLTMKQGWLGLIPEKWMWSIAFIVILSVPILIMCSWIIERKPLVKN